MGWFMGRGSDSVHNDNPLILCHESTSSKMCHERHDRLNYWLCFRGAQHRDLKLSNCMFEDKSDTPIVKIIDFGLCAEFKDGMTSSAFVGTMTYAAPEVGNDTLYRTHVFCCS